ncbi:MAG TPA: hypothetical protein VJ901_17095 [Thermoanaerobaculia bacterium]|nr:hypothetical protein [Thermoanaerobaculia bacterium]
MKKPVIAFAVLLAFAAFADIVRRLGWIDAVMEKRTIGVFLGSIAIVTGNYLPKLRSFRSGNRLLGWIFIAGGSMYVALFTFAPLALARQAAALIGIALIVSIAIQWQPLRFNARQPGTALLLTFVYLLSTAIVVYLFGHPHWAEWLHSAFFASYFWLLAMGEKQCLRG